jgi:DNA/RNA-binding domain of Phe-tRNA-synthetase-like protein
VSWEVTIAESLRTRVSLGIAVTSGLLVRRSSAELNAAMEAQCASIAMRNAGLSSGSVPGVAQARRLYKSLGIDPTKVRPSNEALLRRVLKGEALYRINTLVDVINLRSLSFQLPYGVYDLRQLTPPITLRLGEQGEGYEGIRKDWVNVAGRLTLADAGGPFGNPTSDSARTMITTETTSAMIVIYVSPADAAVRLRSVLEETVALVMRHCGSATAESSIV